ncbi:PAS domain-containing protein [Thiomicrospira sp. WB1]|uniref:PAS domain-containing protein n=1 Tax=Thiomicrospira sp. WB1 TaxID=1685380 RepID=UPI00074B1403|nr:PAS domain-containing protein [Thiomicrospira sp. WB1]KUJ72779.1 hypothetical protein AVO41_03070 [Thiomicrospira sp. WB1]
MNYFPRLEAIATQSVVTVSTQNTIQDAVALMQAHNIRDVIVVDAENHYFIVTPRELIDFKLQGIAFDTPLAEVSLNAVPVMAPTDHVHDALSVLKHHPDHHLCLTDDDGSLVGIVSYSDLLASLDPETVAKTRSIQQLLQSHQPVFVAPEASMQEAFQCLQDHVDSAALVGTSKKPLGILTQSEVVRSLEQDANWSRPVREFMSQPLKTLPPDTSLRDALSFARAQRIKHLVVSDSTQVLAVLHQRDLVSVVFESWHRRFQDEALRLKAEADLFASGPVVVFVWALEEGWPVKFVTPNVQSILGYEADALMADQRPFSELVHPDDLAKVGEEVTTFLAEKRPYWEQHYRLIDHQGQVRWFYDYTRPAYTETCEIKEIYGYLLDQTDLIATQQALSDSEERWRAVLEGTQQGVWDWDATTDRVYFSPRWKAMLGYDENEVGSDLSEWDSRVHPDDKEAAYAALNRHFAGETEFYENTHRVRTKSGEYIWVLDRGRVMSRDETGRPLRVVGTHTDVDDAHKAEEKLSKLAENVPGVLYQYRLYPDGRSHFPYATRGLEAIYGVTPEAAQVSADAVFAAIHPDDRETVVASIQASAEQLCTWQQEYRVVLPSGQTIWVSGQSEPQKLEDNSILWHGYIFDVTERKREQLALEEAQKRYRLTMEASQTGLWSWDLKTDELIWSDEMFTQLGYAPNAFALTEGRFTNLLHPDDQPWMMQEVQRQIAKYESFAVQFRLRNHEGGYSWIEGRGRYTEFDDGGQAIKMMGTHTNIDEQKRTQQALEESEAHFRTLFELYPDATTLFDAETLKPARFNDQAHQQLGYSAEEYAELRIFDFEVMENPEEVRQHAEAIHMNGRDDFETKHRRKNGDIIDVHVTVEKITINGHVYLLGVFRDITEVKRYQTQLEDAKREAEIANQAKSEFLANMSHEIRTPMNGIIGMSELGDLTDDPAQLKDYLHQVHHSGRQLLGIINDILDFSKIEAGKLMVAPAPFYLTELVENLQNLFNPMAKEKGIRLSVNVSDQLGPVYEADSMRLRQVLTNLVGNAIKFTETGQVTLSVQPQSVHANADLSDSVRVYFGIEDTGIGMSVNQQRLLFQPFQQADASTTRAHGGTGLGLVISERLVRAMGGTGIEVQSQLGVGSHFGFVLPLIPSDLDKVQAEQADDLQEMTRLTGHVLLVEDNPINQEVAKAQLNQLGLTYELVTNGREAVEAVDKGAFDLVLMDIQMPEMDGYEATRRIRASGWTEDDLPIIALTAAAMVEDRDKALSHGMNEHIGKPLRLSALYEALTRFLSASPGQTLKGPAMNSKAPASADLTPSVHPEDWPLVDESKGLVQLNGNQVLYDKLLQDVAQQLADDYASLATDLMALQSDDTQGMQSIQPLNHSLKGVAGNLALTRLFEISKTIDQSLKALRKPDSDVIQAFAQALAATRAALAERKSGATTSAGEAVSHQPTNASALSGEQHARLQALLSKIQHNEFLDESDLEAHFAGLPGPEVSALKTQLNDCLDAFEFEQAAEALSLFLDQDGE